MTVLEHRTRLPIDDPAVDGCSAVVHRPAQVRGPAVLLAPGAGGTLDGEGLVALAELLARLGLPVVRVNLPHHEVGRRAAPRANRSVAPYRQLLEAAKRETGIEGPWIAGGKSYGGRVASLAVAEGMQVAGLLFYGYPLHPPGKPDKLRIEHWPNVGVPCLFLQGDRDPFCDLDLLHDHVLKFPRRATVHVVVGGDHSLRITKAASPQQVASAPPRTIAGLEPVVASWVRSLVE